MKIVWVSPDSNQIPIAFRAEAEGHEVRFYHKLKSGSMKGLMKNLRPIDAWRESVSWSELIVFDDVCIDADDLYKTGKLVVAGNALFNQMENDRVFGKKVFKQRGMDICDITRFKEESGFDQAIEFVKKNPDRWVFKPDGQCDRILGFIGEEKNGADMIERLGTYKTNAKGKMKKLWDKDLGISFNLERFAEGMEVACGAYWDGKKFSGINVNFEHKKRSAGDLGITTGEMGTVVLRTDSGSKFYERTLSKLVPILKKFPYHTYVDLNCIVDEDHAYILEVTSRFGWPIEAALATMRNSTTTVGFLKALAAGKINPVIFKEGWSIVYILATYGFPYEVAYEQLGSEQPFKVPKEHSANIFLTDAMMEDNTLLTPLKSNGQIMAVAASGDTLDSAKRQAISIIDKVSLPGKDYRIDIGDAVAEKLEQLKAWGWLPEKKIQKAA